METDEFWWDIRLLRSGPPGRATKADRGAGFRSALEQAEQLFRAASSTSIAASPLLAFYGLSQASRAVLAAHHETPHWNPTGHGLKATNTASALGAVTSRDSGSGVFGALAGVMQSATLPELVTLEGLIAAVPAFVDPSPFANADHPEPLVVRPERLNTGAVLQRTATAVATGWIHGLPALLLDADDPRIAVTAYIEEHYPAFRGWDIAGRPPHLPLHSDGDRLAVKLCWTLADLTGDDDVRAEAVTCHALQPARRGGPYIVPVSIDGTDRVLAPLVHWWAILHALSMVTRYEPAAWRRHTDVDASPDAVGLDRLMEVALADVPGHILQALRCPTAWKQNPATGNE